MNIIKPLLHDSRRVRVRNGAFVLTIIIGFCIELNKCFSHHEELRSEEFILVKQVRTEPQITKYLSPESISPSRSSKVTMLKEVFSKTFFF